MNIRHAALAAFSSSLLLLAGCATPPSTQGVDAAAATFSGTATRVCAVVQPAIAAVQTQASLLDPPLGIADQQKLNDAAGALTTFCAATTTATAATAQGLMNNLFPVVLNVIAGSHMDDKTRNTVILSLIAVQTAANVVLAQAPVAATPAGDAGGAVPQ